MGMAGGGQPNIPGPTLADAGRGRFGLSRRGAILERSDGTTWRAVARYGSVGDADAALDEAIAGGVEPDMLRVVEAGPSAVTRTLVVAGLAALAIAFVFVLYVLFSG